MKNNLRLKKQEPSINKLKGIIVEDITKEKNPIALIEVDRAIQFYNFNDSLYIDDIEAIVEIAKSFEIIYNSL